MENAVLNYEAPVVVSAAALVEDTGPKKGWENRRPQGLL